MSSPGSPRGFTLIEVALLVTILMLLAGVVVPIVRHEVGNARVLRAESDMKVVADAFGRHLAHTGAWPSNEDRSQWGNLTEELAGFPCLYQNVFSKPGWSGPYLSVGVKQGAGWSIARPATAEGASGGMVDPWGRLYLLHSFAKRDAMGAGGGIVLFTCGENGRVDSTRQDIADGAPKGDDLIQVVTRRL